jgi:hypothetical protein
MGWKRGARESRARARYAKLLEKRGGDGCPALTPETRTQAAPSGEDGIYPFVRIRGGEGAWNDYVFNVLMFFFVVFGYGFAAMKAIAYLFLIAGAAAFFISLL